MSETTNEKDQELRAAAEKHDREMFGDKHKMHTVIDEVEGALYIAQMKAKENGGKPGQYISYRKLARMMHYHPDFPEEVCDATVISPELAEKLIAFFDEHPEKLAAFKQEMDQKYRKWEKWYLENGDIEKRTRSLPDLAHNTEDWQCEMDAVMAAQIYINDVYADLFSVFQSKCEQEENIDAALQAVYALGFHALPGFPDIFNPSHLNKHCFANQMKNINRYFKAVFSRSQHISRKKCKTLEGFLYYGLKLELENIHDMMYENAREIAKASMLYWTALDNR